MDNLLESAKKWLLDLGEAYGVDPVVFGVIYLVSIPPYLFSIGWIVRNYTRRISVLLPVISTGFFFIAPAIYLVTAGRNVPWYFYAVVGLMVLYGIYGTWKKIRRSVNKEAGLK